MASQLLINIRKSLEPLFFGAIGVLAFAPFSFKYALFVSYTYVIYRVFKLKNNNDTYDIFLWAIGFWGIGTSWIIVSIYYYGNVSLIGSISLFVILMLGCISLFFLPIILIKRVFKNFSDNFLISVPAILIVVELGRYYFLGGFPWLLPGYIFLDTPFQSLYGLIGVSGLSVLFYFLATVNVLFISKKVYMIFLNIVLFTCLLLPNIFTQSAGDEDSINFSVIQPSTDPFTKFDIDYVKKIEDEFIYLSSLANKETDILVWPEAPMPYTTESKRYKDLISRIDKPLVTGFFSTKEGYLYNSVVNSEQSAIYNKRKLVPFGEYIPFERYLRGLIAFFDMPMSNITRGNLAMEMDVGHKTFTPLVCFDIVFREIVRKDVKSSNYIINVSNDTWFGNSFGPYQHLEISRIRAAENHIPIIRATNDGISALISSNGTIVDYIGKGESGILNVKLVPTDVRTFYNSYGDLFTYFYILIVFLLMFLGRMRNA